MRNLPLTLLVLFTIAIAAVLAVLVSWSPGLRSCGHRRNLLWEINPFHATHCCNSGGVVNELGQIYVAQHIHELDHGGYASSFEQLSDTYTPHLQKSYFFDMVASSNSWSVTVTQQDTLAGSYLMCDNGKLYFSKTKGVTTKISCCAI